MKKLTAFMVLLMATFTAGAALMQFQREKMERDEVAKFIAEDEEDWDFIPDFEKYPSSENENKQ